MVASAGVFWLERWAAHCAMIRARPHSALAQGPGRLGHCAMLRKKAEPVVASAASCSVQAAHSLSATLPAGDTAGDMSDVGARQGRNMETWGHERERGKRLRMRKETGRGGRRTVNGERSSRSRRWARLAGVAGLGIGLRHSLRRMDGGYWARLRA
jgi:hypothetical protein